MTPFLRLRLLHASVFALLFLFAGPAWGQNVGIGTTSPQAKLDVDGKTRSQQLQVTSGAAAGRLLQSDADGNATWVTPGSVFTDTDNQDLMLSTSGMDVTIGIQDGSGGGTFSVADNDNDPANEYNTGLSLSGTVLQITDNGGSVTEDLSSLQEDLYWDRNSGTTYLQNSGDNVGIGVGTAARGKLHIESGANDDAILRLTKALDSPDEYGLIMEMDGDGNDDALIDLRAQSSGSSVNENNTVFYVNGDGALALGHDYDIGNGPASQLEVSGGASIGSGYIGNGAPTDGLQVEGWVGIGTTNPSERLDVQGNIDVNQNSVFLRNGSGTTYGLGFDTEGGDQLTLFTDDHFSITESDNDNTVFRIEGNDGHVGINTTNPTTDFDVNGGVRIRGGGPQDGYVLSATDNNGNATWEDPRNLTRSEFDFTVGGNTSTFYPVLIDIEEDNRGLSRFIIHRSSVHENGGGGSFLGSFAAEIKFWGRMYGNTSRRYSIDYYRGNGSNDEPLGDIADGSNADGDDQVILWLKGGLTYHVYSLSGRVALDDGNPGGGNVTDNSGNTRTPAGSRNLEGDFVHYFQQGITTGGSVGIGTRNTPAKLTVDNGTNTEARILSDDNGRSMLSLYGENQGTGRLYVGQDANYGGGLEYNGDGSPGTSGAGSDYITLYRRSSSSDYWTARNSHNSNNWEFREDLYTGDQIGVNTTNPGGLVRINGGKNPNSYNQGNVALEIDNAGNEDAILQANGGTAPYRITIQDGHGRVHHYWNAYDDDNDHRYDVGGEGATWMRMNGGDLAIRTAGSGSAGDIINWNLGLQQDYQGNVGIKESNPDYTLDVNGGSRIGWHGHPGKITILPTDFMADGDDGDEQQGYIDGAGSGSSVFNFKTSDNDPEAYAFYRIPHGYRATGCRIYASQNNSVKAWYPNIYNGDQTNYLGSSSMNSYFTFSYKPNADWDNFLVIELNMDNPTEVWGGYIDIERIP
jgi:hypothetical protein